MTGIGEYMDRMMLRQQKNVIQENRMVWSLRGIWGYPREYERKPIALAANIPLGINWETLVEASGFNTKKELKKRKTYTESIIMFCR